MLGLKQTQVGLKLAYRISTAKDVLAFHPEIKRQRLGEALGVQGQAVSKKLRGQSRWTIEEIYAMAEFFLLILWICCRGNFPGDMKLGPLSIRGPN